MTEMAWIKNGFRQIYGKREIRRGRRKGSIEVTYRANGNVMRRRIITKNALKLGGQFENELRAGVQPKEG